MNYYDPFANILLENMLTSEIFFFINFYSKVIVLAKILYTRHIIFFHNDSSIHDELPRFDK